MNIRHIASAILLLAFLPAISTAASKGEAKGTTDAIAFCIDRAAADFGIDSLILQTIYDVEGGRVGQAVKNTNGSYDLGPMQINTIHLPDLKREFGITRDELQNDACTNVYVAALLFSRHYNETKDVASAMARYHSKTPKYQARYLKALSGALDRRLAQIEKAPK